MNILLSAMGFGQPLSYLNQEFMLSFFAILYKVELMLRSSKAVTKEPMQMAPRFGRSSPHPWLGSVVELRCRHLHRLFNLSGITTFHVEQEHDYDTIRIFLYLLFL